MKYNSLWIYSPVFPNLLYFILLKEAMSWKPSLKVCAVIFAVAVLILFSSIAYSRKESNTFFFILLKLSSIELNLLVRREHQHPYYISENQLKIHFVGTLFKTYNLIVHVHKYWHILQLCCGYKIGYVIYKYRWRNSTWIYDVEIYKKN